MDISSREWGLGVIVESFRGGHKSGVETGALEMIMVGIVVCQHRTDRQTNSQANDNDSNEE
jgi:hypothetical protein